MTEEEKKEYMKICYDGLNSLNVLIDGLLGDENFLNDVELINTKNDIGQSLSDLSDGLDCSNNDVIKK